MTKGKSKAASIACLFALTLGGCASPEARVKTAVYDPAPRAATVRLDVYQPGEKLSRAYHTIALLTVEGAAHEEGDCVQGMVAAARKLGADGLALLVAEAPNPKLAFQYGLAVP